MHSRRVKQSLDMLTSQIEKIQGERDSFRSILNHREEEMEELFRSKMEVGWCEWEVERVCVCRV